MFKLPADIRKSIGHYKKRYDEEEFEMNSQYSDYIARMVLLSIHRLTINEQVEIAKEIIEKYHQKSDTVYVQPTEDNMNKFEEFFNYTQKIDW